MPVAIRVSLEEDSIGHMFGSICGDSKRGGEVGKVENRL